MRLRSHLFLLVLATAVPLLAFALLASGLLVQHENENFVAAVKNRNRAFMSAVDAELKGSIVTLQALASSRRLAQGDLKGFHDDARAVLTTQPNWLNVILLSADGRQLVNAATFPGEPLPAKPEESRSLQQAIATLSPAVGGVQSRGPFINRPGIPLRVPLVREGKLAYVLTALLKPESFQALFESQHVPEGWVSGLVDAQGRLIARVPPKPIGSMASRDYLAAVHAETEGWYRGTTIEGLDTYTAHVTSAVSGWSLGFAIPAELVVGPAKHAGWLLLSGALLSFAAALLIALWLGRRVSRPMSELAQAAGRLGRGGTSFAARSSINEVDELAGALDAASRAIQERDQALRTQTAELKRADANKTQFLAMLSHELRNPLAPLANGLTLLGMRYPQAGPETQAMMERQIRQLARLIDDLLDVSRIDRGKLELRRDRVAIDAVVRTGIETAKPGIEAKAHELTVRYASEPLYVEGDAVRLSQVVSNLLNNAAKFTPPGGRIEIALRADSGAATISVKDNGIGFAPGEDQRIFDMFVQLDASRTQATGGLGLGLTLVRSLVAMHGGSVEARSAGPGSGAEFIVRLPLAAAAAPSAIAAVRPARSARGRGVLIVDDNADAADSLAQILRLEGFEVRACYDGAEALRSAREFRPDVAFIDLNMPGMSGTELAARLRSESWAGAITLVALTGMGQKSDLEATRAAGFDAHLTKPADSDDVVRLASAENGGAVLPFRSERGA
jgi:signal transduction histidine kinase/ActR/RegA family two-component response regulator